MRYIILAACLFLAACSMLHIAPRAAVQIPGGSKVNLSGEAATPAHVNETTVTASLPVPAQSTVTTSPVDGTVQVKLSLPTLLTVNTRNTKVDGPVAYQPPTPLQNAEASTFKWFVLAALLCGIAAAIAAYFQHYLAAIKFTAAGVAFPVLYKVFSSTAALFVGGALIVAGLVFVIAWYVIESKKPAAAISPTINPVKT